MRAASAPSHNPSLHALSALEQARRIRGGSLSSEELVSHYLDRIARLDGKLSAFVQLWPEQALAEARRKDRARRGTKPPPFHGVPVAVKDLHFLRGRFARMGSRSYRWLWSPFDDVTVRAVRRAGFVIVGKTSTSELALMPIVEPDIHPPTRNPWDPSRTSGGSSGGAGVAVAARMLPLSPGSDGAGSIRIPSALCGIVGLKPSRGLVPNPTARIDPFGMTTVGPMARDVDDAAALLDVLLGRDPASPRSYLEGARATPPKMTIGVMTFSPLGDPIDPAITSAVEEAAQALAALGHRIVPVAKTSASLDEFLPIYQRLFANAPILLPWLLQPVTRWFYDEGKRRTHAEAQALLERLSARSNAAFDGCDAVITPTTSMEAPAVGAFNHLAPEAMFRALSPLGAFTAPCNITGAPGATVPWSLSPRGLPLGVQVIGRPGEDARVLALARQIEGLRPNPPGFAPTGE